MSWSQDPTPRAVPVPGYQATYARLLAEYPELCEDLSRLVNWRDQHQQDQKGKHFNRQWPNQKPQPWGNPITCQDSDSTSQPSILEGSWATAPGVKYDPQDTTPPCQSPDDEV